MSHTCLECVTRVNKWFCTHEWLVSHVWMSRGVSHVNESCPTRQWVMSHMCISHVAHVNEWFRTLEWVVSQVWMSPFTHMNESRHTCKCVISYMWMSDFRHANESYYGVATISRLLKIIGLFCKRALENRLYSAKETYELRSLLIVATPYTHSWVIWHMCMSRVTHMHGSFRTCDVKSCHTCEWVLRHMWTSCVMGWLRLVGSFKF